MGSRALMVGKVPPTIQVDSRVGSRELLPLLRNLGVKAELTTLEFGDVALEGNDAEGKILVGIERKRVHDMLNCIDDGRFAGFQQPGMADIYQYRFLIVEGVWKPSPEGFLMERQGPHWKHPTGRPVVYDKLFSFLISVSFIGHTIYSRSSDIAETARQIVAIYKYFSKDWDDHTSQYEIHRPPLPQFTRASFERRVASQIDGVGVKKSREAELHFRTVPNMVKATEREWMAIVGPKQAQRIVRQIWKVPKGETV